MKRWKIAEKDPLTEALAEQLGTSRIISQLLVNRNIKDYAAAQKFLYPKRNYLYPPSLLPDLERAVCRIKKAIDNREKILLFGDYDVDGVTSLAMMSDYLSKKKIPLKVLIPSRLHQGYGFNREAIEAAKKEGIALIISCDCGTNSLLIDEAINLGIDVIVIDHHQVLQRKRNFLLINPKRKDSNYPFKEVSTGLLVFKLICALKDEFASEYLDLVTLSIVCDVAPLIDENRILVKEGLIKIRNNPCLGLECLMNESSVRKEYVGVFHLGWILGPRLNASGRMSLAYPAFELLSSESYAQAKKLAGLLDSDNKTRRTESKRLLSSALAKVESEIDLDKDYVIVLSEQDWHIGILGIAASCIKEKFSRPAFLISLYEGLGKGSGRSIENFHIMDALEECKEYLKDFGGHKKACGIEIEKDQIDKFRKAINLVAKRTLSKKDLVTYLYIDREISLQEISPQLIEMLSLFIPFGEANPEPFFLTSKLRVKNVTNSNGTDKLVWFQTDRCDRKICIYPARVSSNDKIFQLLEYGDYFDIVYNLRQEKGQPAQQIFLNLQDTRISQEK